MELDVFEPLEIFARHTRTCASFAKTQASYDAAVGALRETLGGLKVRPPQSLPDGARTYQPKFLTQPQRVTMLRARIVACSISFSAQLSWFRTVVGKQPRIRRNPYAPTTGSPHHGGSRRRDIFHRRHWRSSQSNVPRIGRFSNGTSSDSRRRPSGSIHKPRTGRRLNIPARTSTIPNGMRNHREEGLRNHWTNRLGRSGSSLCRRSILRLSLSSSLSVMTHREASLHS